jgi:hypothetical protein
MINRCKKEKAMIKKEFNWEKFLSNKTIGVHCSTEEQAIDFCKQMHEHELRWRDGESYLEDISWQTHKEDTCYFSDGCRSDLAYPKKAGYKILEWSSYMSMEHQEALKFLLNQGYVVVHEDDTLSKVERNENGDLILSGEVHCCFFADIQGDLSIKNHDGGMIKEIYGYSDSKRDAYRLSLEGRNCIWERGPLKEFDEKEFIYESR